MKDGTWRTDVTMVDQHSSRADWMTLPQYFSSSPAGIVAFDKSGREINTSEHPKWYLERMEYLNSNESSNVTFERPLKQK